LSGRHDDNHHDPPRSSGWRLPHDDDDGGRNHNLYPADKKDHDHDHDHCGQFPDTRGQLLERWGCIGQLV
jgi:hypothetical protein